MASINIDAVIRGKVYCNNLVRYAGRGDDVTLVAPSPASLLDELPLGNPNKMEDLYTLRFQEIVDYLAFIGEQLHPNKNEYIQEAIEAAYLTAPMSAPLLDEEYSNLPALFNSLVVREIAEKSIGIKYLDGWVEETLENGNRIAIRAFGCRALHIVAGNTPLVAALTIVRNAVTRSDGIIKVASNDPLTATAIAKTMIKVEPDHPITRHLSVAYWKGGLKEFEDKLYQPHCIEKIIAWGGLQSIKHITGYVQPGLELISLNPKRSIGIVGAEAFENEGIMREVAAKVAVDIGAFNQAECTSARVIYAITGTGREGIANINRLGEYVYDALVNLPKEISTKAKVYNRELRSHVEAARVSRDWYKVYGGQEGEGAIIVSQSGDVIDFAPLLSDRTANLVPVGDIGEIIRNVTSYTQTVGVYPEELRMEMRDMLPLYGAQRIVPLGSSPPTNMATPQDGIEPVRRMCKWVVDESTDQHAVREFRSDQQF